MTTDQQGEGFAFFRWHYLDIGSNPCCGINDRRPGFGKDGCARLWKELRDKTALQETSK